MGKYLYTNAKRLISYRPLETEIKIETPASVFFSDFLLPLHDERIKLVYRVNVLKHLSFGSESNTSKSTLLVYGGILFYFIFFLFMSNWY